MRQPAYSGQFKRDVKLAERRGKDMAKLKAVMTLSIEETPLPSNLLDHPLRGNWHPLRGNWRGCRDLHIEPDWLLLYSLDGDIVRFERTGRHTDLFDE